MKSVLLKISSGWYFAPELSHSLFGNVPVNALDEWDVNKLGWFKSRRARDHIDTGAQIRRAFTVNVENCRKNSYSAEVKCFYLTHP